MKIILDMPYAHIAYDGAKERLYQTWKGFATVEQFSSAIDASVKCFEQNKAKTILSDTTNQAVLAKEATDYAAGAMPALVKHGLERIAFVLPKSVFAQMSLQNFSKKSDNQLLRHFGNREEAEAWLEQ